MGRKSRKTILLETFKQILHEYENNIHVMTMSGCALCNNFIFDMDYDYDCSACPMIIFDPEQEEVPCQARQCSPIHCSPFMKGEIKLKRVITFYKRVIERIELMSTDAVRRSKLKFMIKIDREVAKLFES